jgi:hypothetical protein
MMDLHTRLERLGGTIESPSTAEIDADLARSRRARRRRRAFQTAGGAAFGTAAILAAFSFTGAQLGHRDATRPAPPVAHASARHLQLVDYRGTQPKYFTVDRVPAGFFVQDQNESGIMLAPIAARNPGPDVDPSASPIFDPHDFGGKIGVFLERRGYRTASGDKVTVGDKAGVLMKLPPVGTAPGDPTPTAETRDTAWQLFIEESADVWAVVQFDGGLGLSRAQMLEVGAGLHVHPEAIDAVQPLPQITKRAGN